METVETLKMRMNEQVMLLEKDPDINIKITYNHGLSEEEISSYESRIGYRLPEGFREFYLLINGLTIEKNDEKFILWTLSDIYDKLKYNQKNDIYLHPVEEGYHVQIAEHDCGALIMNVNGQDNYLYVSNASLKDWLGINSLTTFFTNYLNCYYTAFWKDLKALEYFDKK